MSFTAKQLIAAIESSQNFDALYPEEKQDIYRIKKSIEKRAELHDKDVNTLKHLKSVICWK